MHIEVFVHHLLLLTRVTAALSQVRIMKKRLVRKTFDMVEEIANREKKEVLYAEV